MKYLYGLGIFAQGPRIAADMSRVVWLIVAILVVGLVYAALHYLIRYYEREVPDFAPFGKIARLVLVTCAVLFVIFLMLSFIGLVPGVITW